MALMFSITGEVSAGHNNHRYQKQFQKKLRNFYSRLKKSRPIAGKKREITLKDLPKPVVKSILKSFKHKQQIDNEQTSYLNSVFKNIAHSFPNIKLDANDLFHGHIIKVKKSDEIVVVFHAKEYPSDFLGSQKNHRMEAHLKPLMNLLNGVTSYGH
jgi:hypothetical protein